MLGEKKTETNKNYYNSIEVLNSIDEIKGTVAINWKLLPKQVGKLELHSDNYRGLFFIYNHIIEEIARDNRAINKKS